MINPNLTMLANMTEEFNETALSISGTINGTTPVSLTFSHIPSVVVSQPAYTFSMGMMIVQTLCLLTITAVIVTCGYVWLTRRKL